MDFKTELDFYPALIFLDTPSLFPFCFHIENASKIKNAPRGEFTHFFPKSKRFSVEPFHIFPTERYVSRETFFTLFPHRTNILFT